MRLKTARVARRYGAKAPAYRRVLLMAAGTAALVVLSALLPMAPSYAASSKDKAATCKFGADDQHLKGKARTAFMKKCMSNQDEPRGGAAPATVPAH
jgi:hypothetical protein